MITGFLALAAAVEALEPQSAEESADASAGTSASQEVVAVGDLIVESRPGEILTFAYRITNTSEQHLELRPEISEPYAWKLLTGRKRFSLGPGATSIQLVSYSLSPGAPAGDYFIAYKVSNDDGSHSGGAEVRRVEVAAVDRLRLDILEVPRYVLAGDSYEAQLRVSNESNRAHSIVLEWTQSRELPLVSEPSEVYLKPGESSLVRVRVDVPDDIFAKLQHGAVLMARLSDDRSIADTESIKVTVLPIRAASARKRHRLDGALEIRASSVAGDSHGRSFQMGGTLSLSGDLDEDAQRHLELFLQGPEVMDPGSVRRIQEELRLELTTPVVNLLVGDFSPSSSRLVSQFRGRGARLAVHQDRWELGARYLRTDHRTRLRVEESALFGELRIGEQTIRAQYVRRSMASDTESELLDLSALLHPWDSLSLRLGLGYGRLLNPSSEPANGWAGEIEVLGRRKRWSYNVGYLFGEQGFPGQYAGRSSLYGGVNAQLTWRWSVFTNARRGREPEEADLIYTVPPVASDYANGLSYRLTRNTTVRLEHRTHSRQEINDIAAVDLEEETIRFSLTQHLQHGQVALRVDSGDGRDLVANSSFELRRYSLDASYRPSEKLDLQASIEKTREISPDGRRQDYLSGLVRGKWQIGDKLALGIYYRQWQRQYRTSANSAQSRLRLVRALSRGHEVSMEVSRTRTTGLESQTFEAVLLGYTVPLSVPATRRRHIGALHGRVRDEQSGLPLANVVLRLGGVAARTDEDGNFTIAALGTGSYPITMDTSRLGYRRLPSLANPELIEVLEGENRPLDLWLTTAGALRGVVTREQSEEERWSSTDRSITASPEEKAIPVANVVVELSDGHATIRRMTDSAGRFVFDVLQPGVWSVRAIGSLPEGYVAVYDDPEIEIPAGSEAETMIHLRAVRTQHRRIPADRDAPLQVGGRK